MRVLLVDDDEVDRAAVRRALRAARLEAQIDEAEDRRGAFAALHGPPFDCVLLDYRLPGEDGLEILRKMRAAGVNTPVIMLTGHGDEQTAVELMKAGASDYLVKNTLTPDRLAFSVRHAIERKELEDERRLLLGRERAARLEAEAANRGKDQFVAMLSHELRTPLGSILGWTRILQSGGADAPKTEHALEVIERNAKALAQLIDDLLDVSRMVGGRLSLEVGSVEPAAVIRGAADIVRPSAEAKAIRLELDLAPDVMPIPGDPDRLQQVVWNLLSNAIKFTPGGGHVDVRLGRRDRTVTIQVSDTGRGISSEFLPHVFERFRQDDAGRTEGGLGLGLAIVRHIVELHGGAVRAESAGEGRGATFTVELPAGLP